MLAFPGEFDDLPHARFHAEMMRDYPRLVCRLAALRAERAATGPAARS